MPTTSSNPDKTQGKQSMQEQLQQRQQEHKPDPAAACEARLRGCGQCGGGRDHGGGLTVGGAQKVLPNARRGGRAQDSGAEIEQTLNWL